jgi:hypothetical protein
MRKFLLSVILGIIAGIIDVTPMIMRGVDGYAAISPFLHWVVQGFIITYAVLRIKDWLKGFIIAELSAIPVIFQPDIKSAIPILAMSAVLGSLIGFLSGRYAKKRTD